MSSGPPSAVCGATRWKTHAFSYPGMSVETRRFEFDCENKPVSGLAACVECMKHGDLVLFVGQLVLRIEALEAAI